MVVSPLFVRLLFKNFLWKVNTDEKTIYLTFDDGPTPKITDWVLDQLNKFNAKATFFCIGKNIEAYPEIFKRVLKEGHTIGNHTLTHVKGWQSKKSAYINNVLEAQSIIDIHSENNIKDRQFRPPYGKITFAQAKALRKLNYNIVMWHVVAYDWDKSILPENCLKNIVDNAIPGSIVVLHDSIKAFPNLEIILPQALKYFSELGYQFKAL